MSELSLISVGPGDLNYLLPVVKRVVESAEILIGYTLYLDQLKPFLRDDQQLITSKLGSEIDRATQAVDLAAAGKRVALVSSGDIGVYAMASPVFDVLRERGWDGTQPTVTVYPGISAIQATAARVGAPLGHDFCTISLSDLLTPWEMILRRVKAAAWGDFVVGFYNPRSQKRHWQLGVALEILREFRPKTTPVVIARNMTRPDETVTLTTLADVNAADVDMFTLVLVGNSQSYELAGRMATPRGYVGEQFAVNGEQSTEHSARSSHSTTSPITDYRLPTTYPIALPNLRNAKCIVVGGGMVGTRKVKGLLAVGAAVTVVAGEISAELRELVENGSVHWLARDYAKGDLVGAKLAFAATDVREVNAAVSAEAHALGILHNVADAPDEGDFYSLAIVRHEDSVIAIGTDGASPKRAKALKAQIATWLQSK